MGRSKLFRRVRRLFRTATFANQRNLDSEQITSIANEAVTRRQVVLGGAGALLLGPVNFRKMWTSRTAEPVIIVGGGYAGLTCAYRLAKAGIASHIYEANSHLGGRVFTKSNFNSAGMFCELGAELVDTNHEALMNLCAEIGVEVETFPNDDANLARNVTWFDGKIRTDQQIIEGFRPIAKKILSDLEPFTINGVVQYPNYQNPGNAKALDETSLEEYLRRLEGFGPKWVTALLERAYVGEYGLEAGSQSALNLLLLIGTDWDRGVQIFGASDEAKRIRGGGSQLTKALAQAIRNSAAVELEHRLIHIRDRQNHFQLSFQTAGGVRTIRAARVVLTLPFSTLRRVEGVSALALSPAKKLAIAETTYGTNAKYMHSFKSRFWRTPKSGPPSVGTMYGDFLASEYWETSLLQNGKAGVLTAFLGGRVGKTAAPNLSSRLLKEIGRIYPEVGAQFDGHRTLKNWSQDSGVHGSYTCPGPGHYTRFLGAAGENELNDRLLFAGEHCSVDFQGFMNGAIESGNAAAEKIAGVHKVDIGGILSS